MQKTLKLILLTALLLISSSLVLWKVFKPQEIRALPEAITAEELLKYTIEMEEITTNLHAKGYAKLKFQLQADSVHAKEELEYRMSQIRHMIIGIVSAKSLEELKGEKGITSLELSLKDQINQLLESGQVLKIFTTGILLQD